MSAVPSSRAADGEEGRVEAAPPLPERPLQPLDEPDLHRGPQCPLAGQEERYGRGTEAAGPRQLPLRHPAEQFHSKPKTVRGHAGRSPAAGCLRKRPRGADGQAPSLSGHAFRRGCVGGWPRRRRLRDTRAGGREASGPRGGKGRGTLGGAGADRRPVSPAARPETIGKGGLLPWGRPRRGGRRSPRGGGPCPSRKCHPAFSAREGPAFLADDPRTEPGQTTAFGHSWRDS